MQNKQNGGCDWSSSHQGQQAPRGPDPGGEREAGGIRLLREVHPLSQVFSKRTETRGVSNYAPIKEKDVTWEGAAAQRLAELRRARALSLLKLCASPLPVNAAG